MINAPAHPPFMQLLIYFRHDLKAYSKHHLLCILYLKTSLASADV
jgi:hypothetical protein